MEGEGDALVGNTTWQLSPHPTSTSGANPRTTRDSLYVKQTGFYIRLHKGSMHTLTIYYLLRYFNSYKPDTVNIQHIKSK